MGILTFVRDLLGYLNGSVLTTMGVRREGDQNGYLIFVKDLLGY